MAKSKPRKKYNHNKAKINASNRICHNAYVLCVLELGDDGVKWFKNGKANAITHYTPAELHFMYSVSRPWSFVFGALCRDQLGDGYIKYEYIGLNNQFAFTDPAMEAFAKENMNAIAKSVNPEHLLSTFFIASPEKIEFSDEQVKRLVATTQAEQLLKTPFEMQQLEKSGLTALRKIDPTQYCDPKLWGFLTKNGIQDFADFRLAGLSKISEFKGIGKKRCEQLTDAYIKMEQDQRHNPELADYWQYEEQIRLHFCVKQQEKRIANARNQN